jgi:tetratricopeptide (TPR) repeat protein
MAEQHQADLAVSPEQRRKATQLFERARQVLTTGNHDYVIELLQMCCKLDPTVLVYRQVLRGTEKRKYDNNLRGSPSAWLTNLMPKSRQRSAKRRRQYRAVLEHGEAVLARNPWDTAAQLDMAHAADQLGLLEVAVFILEQARQKNPESPRVNKALALLYERQGNYTQAIILWDLVAKANPKDMEARGRGKDLAATHTIDRGGYESKALGGDRATFKAPSNPPGGSEADKGALTRSKEFAALDEHTARQAAPLRNKIEIDPTNVHAYSQLTTLYQRTGHWDLARRVLQEGLQATGQNFDLVLRGAELEIEMVRQNLEITEQKLRAKPHDAQLQQMRAQLDKEVNSRELELFRRRADRYPSDLSHRMEVGIRLLRIGQADEAIQELQIARKDPRSKWRALMYLGHSFKAKKNWPLAKRNFEEALQALPHGEESDRKELLFQLAQGAAEQQDWNSAVELGGELANMDYAFQGIGKLLEQWQKKLDQVNA